MGLLDDKKATIRNIPRSGLLGTFADILQAGKDNTGVVGDFLLGQAPEVLNNMSYGFNPTRGRGMTYGLKPEAADLVNVVPTATIGGLLAKGYAQLAGKEIARQVQSGTGVLGRNVIDPRMQLVESIPAPAWKKQPTIRVGSNPSKEELQMLAEIERRNSGYGDLRGLLPIENKPGTAYFWPASDALHQDIGAFYKLNPKDYQHVVYEAD